MNRILLLLCILGCASPQPDPFFDLQGHRGARGLLPENTIGAFTRALEMGVTTLEMDVVIAKDSTVVVSHEPWMSDVICADAAGGREHHNIFAMTYAEVSRYDCGSLGHPSFPRQQKTPAAKPRLLDVLKATETHARVRYNIEIKSNPDWDGLFTPDPATFARLVLDALEEGGVRDRAVLQSFDVRTLQAARRLDPRWPLALLVGEGSDLEAHLTRLGFTPAIYSPNYRLVDEDLVRSAHEVGMRLIPWTVNTLADMQRLKDLGVDGLITDYPDIGRALLE